MANPSSPVTFQLTSSPKLSVIRVTVKYTPAHSAPIVTDAKAGLAERSMALTVITRGASVYQPLLSLAIRVDSP
jgi:hypothetical protein